MWKTICIIVSAILLLVIVVLIILYFTVFKPTEPKIIAHPATLEKIHVLFPPLWLINVTLGVGVTIDNRNYGSFKYQNSTAYVSYRGDVIGEAPIEADAIPARRKHDIGSSLTIFADKLVGEAMFLSDVLSGVVNFTSVSTLHGKVTVFKLFKAKATSFSTCNISLYVTILDQHLESACQSKLSF